MPYPLPKGQNFYIARRSLPATTEMPTLEVAPGFYQMGLLLSGDRYTITSTGAYIQHQGCLGLLPPYVYHRTFPASNAPYENYLLKFTAEFAQDFILKFGQHTLDSIYAHPINYFHDEDREEVYLLFAEMLIEYEGSAPHRDYALQTLLYRLFTILLDRRLPDMDDFVPDTPLTPEIMNAVYYIGKHYAKNPTLEEVAAYACFSNAYFSRLFKKQLNRTYSEYLAEVKLRAVCELLLHSDKSVTEIAHETGYPYPGNLTAQFKRVIGMSPLKYRKQNEHHGNM